MIQYHNNNNMSLFPKGIEDIHTHDVSRSESAVVNISPSGVFPDVIRWASVGIHPWNASVTDEETFLILEEMASDVRVVAIGEAGLDRVRGGLISDQEIVFRRQVDISENLRKPMVLHVVRAFDRILHLRKKLNPSQVWIIHGFRGNPVLAGQLLDSGMDISLGEYFNRDTAKVIPAGRLYFETDESNLDIKQIRAAVEAARNNTII